MRDVSRQLTIDELAELFSGRTRFVEKLVHEDDPLGRARDVAHGLTDDEKAEALAAHPRIGERSRSSTAATPPCSPNSRS